MENLDRLLPVVALLGVGAFLLVLLRVARSERQALATQPEQPMDVPIAAPLDVPLATPVASSAPEPSVMPASAKTASDENSSPLQNVLELIKTKDALVKAFLLREILGPPVSCRRRRTLSV